MASSPPQGGTTARIAGSSSIRVSSAARCSFGAEVTRSPDMHSPTSTSKPRARNDASAASSRGRSRPGTPLEGEVTPMVSPGWSGRGKRMPQVVIVARTTRAGWLCGG